MLCHTKISGLPNQIISHGLITNSQGKKIKWSPNNFNNTKSIYSPKAIRCILLKNNIFKGVKFNEEQLDSQVKQVTKYYIKIKKMLEKNNKGILSDYSEINHYIEKEWNFF